jgi:hypothetical protein
MNGVTYFSIFFIMGLETHLNLNKDISPTIHQLILWIEVFIFLPFMVYMIAENKSKEIRRQMILFAMLGFLIGFFIFK